MNNPLISIVMATFNGDKYLKDQLDSILAQTYQNFEIIICDDKSTDNTPSILQEYSVYNATIKYEINERRLGVTKNFEKAISIATGDYIVLCDQDDIWRFNKLERLKDEISSYSLIYSNASFIDGSGNTFGSTMNEKYYLFGLDSENRDFFKYLLLNSFILGCSTMFEKKLLETALPLYESSRNHDWWLTYSANQANGVKYLDEVLFDYRIHSTNYSRSTEKITFVKKVIYFFSDERKKKRQYYINELKEIVKYIIRNKSYTTKSEKNFVDEILDYCNSFFSTVIHVKTFIIGMKNRKYFFPEDTKINSYIHTFSRIIG